MKFFSLLVILFLNRLTIQQLFPKFTKVYEDDIKTSVSKI
jgi:hypothetical protein